MLSLGGFYGILYVYCIVILRGYTFQASISLFSSSMHAEEIRWDSQETSWATWIFIYNFTVVTSNNKQKESLLCFYEWGAPYITLLIAGVYSEKLSLSGCDKIIKGLQLDLLPQVPRY